MNCPNCGAPFNYGDRCEYCGTIYDFITYKIKQDRISELQQELEKLKYNIATQIQTQYSINILNFSEYNNLSIKDNNTLYFIRESLI